MEKRNAIILIFGLVLLIVLPSIVSAAFSDIFGSGAGTILGQWGNGGEINLQVAKIALFFIVLILVYVMVKLVPGVKRLNALIRIIFSGLIAFLATAYFTPEAVYTILMSYSGLGFALSAGLPFIILIGFTVQSAFDTPETAMDLFMQKMFAGILWLMLSCFMIYRLFEGGSNAGGLYLAQIVMVIASLVMAVGCFQGFIFRWAYGQADRTTKELAKRKANQAVDAIGLLSGVERAIANAEPGNNRGIGT